MSWKSQLLRPHADPKNKPQHLTTRPVWQWQERQTHQNGDSSPERVDKYCQQIFGDVWNLYTLFTRFCLLFLAYTFIESIYIYISIALSVNHKHASNLVFESNLRWYPQLRGGIPCCQSRHPQPSFGTFETDLQHMSWNLPDKTLKSSQTFRNFSGFLKHSNSPKLSKNKAKPTFQIPLAMKKLQKHLWNLCIQNLPNSGTCLFIQPQPASTTTCPPFRFFSRIPAWTLTTKLKKAHRSSPNIKLVCIDPRKRSVRAIVWP